MCKWKNGKYKRKESQKTCSFKVVLIGYLYTLSQKLRAKSFSVHLIT